MDAGGRKKKMEIQRHLRSEGGRRSLGRLPAFRHTHSRVCQGNTTRMHKTCKEKKKSPIPEEERDTKNVEMCRETRPCKDFYSVHHLWTPQTNNLVKYNFAGSAL